MRPGWDARKRNRNIGTSKHGHGRDNRLVIPRGIHDDRIFWSKLIDPVAVPRSVGGCRLTFLVEPTFPNFLHACTVDDICYVLGGVPQEHLREIELILLRQPKRKEVILSPVWGRFIYYADTGEYSGTAICLEAQNPQDDFLWGKSLSPEDQVELQQLTDDGHTVTKNKRGSIIQRTPESIRSTQLYRTLLHELGHCVDWLTHCLKPVCMADDDAERERIEKAFAGKPSREKEAFANRYARELRTALAKLKRIPFKRILNPPDVLRDGLDPAWFGQPASNS